MAVSPRNFRADQSPSQWTFPVSSQGDLVNSQGDEEVSPLLRSSSSESDSGDRSPLIRLSTSQIKSRLSSSQEEVDFFQSPPLSPACSSTQSSLTLTPERVTQAKEVFKGHKAFDCEPMPSERNVIEKGMEALKLQSPDGPDGTRRSKNSRECFWHIFKRASKVGPESSPNLVSNHDQLIQMMESVRCIESRN